MKYHPKTYLSITGLFVLVCLPGLSVASVDDDNDGSPNIEETLAGTDPNDATVRPFWWKTFEGEEGARYGEAVSGAGDVNNDGYDDFIIGAYYYTTVNGDSGQVEVISGKTGEVLYTLIGEDNGDGFGVAVSGAGDIDQDGYADFIVGASADDNGGSGSGQATVYSGIDGALLYEFVGSTSDGFGLSVGAVGDFNSDGYDDVVVGSAALGVQGYAKVFSGADGAELYTYLSCNSGNLVCRIDEVDGVGDVNNDGYDDVILGMGGRGSDKQGLVVVISGIDGSELYNMAGGKANDYFGYSVSGAGDINQDGYDDFSVGAYGADVTCTNSGEVKVFSGVDGSVLLQLLSQTCGDDFGISVDNAGDMDGDGYSDIIVGAKDTFNDGGSTGAAWIFSGLSGDILHVFYGDGIGDDFGYAVAGAGDIDDDGYADLIVGARLDDNAGSNSGSARVYRYADILNDVDLDMVLNSADVDDDGDGLSDIDENTVYFTNPLDADTDGDGFNDYDEVIVFSTNPLVVDGDNDSDGEPDNYDVDDDNDLMLDSWEVAYGLNPLDSQDARLDGDMDGWTNIVESLLGTNPSVSSLDDTDMDGVNDVEEGQAGTDSNNASNRPYWWRSYNGDYAGDTMGTKIAVTADVNGDGYADFAASYNGQDSNANDSFRVWSGKDGAVLYDLLDMGYEIAAIDDVNQDGYGDWVIGTIYDDVYGEVVRVVSGVDGSVLLETNSFNNIGWTVSQAGDVNNDGYPDFMSGKSWTDSDGFSQYCAGGVRVFSGLDGGVLYNYYYDRFDGDRAFASALSDAGDINNDGYDDFIVGAPEVACYFFLGSLGKGRVWVYSGFDGSELYDLLGDNDDARFGAAVSGVGDINKDGYDDFAVGAYRDNANYEEGGSVYVYSGFDGAELYRVDGLGAHESLGRSIGAAGDINADTYPDFIVGGGGFARVISGADGSGLYTLPFDSSAGTILADVASGQDIDQDGVNDFVIADRLFDANGTNAGGIRVILSADLANDTDVDFWLNSADVFPNDSSEWADNDLDTIGDNADTDDDNDMLSDSLENALGLNPLEGDSDGDGLPDIGEDSDGDGIPNIIEVNKGLDPGNSAISTLPLNDNYRGGQLSQ